LIETLGSLYREAGHEFPPVQERSESISSAIPGTSAYDALTFGTPTYTGRSINPMVASTSTAVWACKKLLSESVASCSLLTYNNLSPDGLVRELATTDYRYRMLREQPNPEMSSYQWRQFGMLSLLDWGNWFNWLDLDGRGRIRQIYPMRSDWMVVLRNPQTMLLEYRYQPLYPFGTPVPAGIYHPDEILHVPGMGWDGLIGYSPIAMCRNAIALGMSMEEYSGRFIAGGGTKKVALVAPAGATVKDPEKTKADWRRANGSLNNVGDVAVLHGGMDVKTYGVSQAEAQFLEGRSFQIAEVARIFNVPLGMLHDALSKPETYASAEQADQRFVKYSIRPWCISIEQRINTSVLGSNDKITCQHDLTDLLRGDLQSQMNAYKTGVTGGIVMPDEARAKLDLPPYGGPAKKLYMQGQMVEMGKTPPKPKALPLTPQNAPVTPQE